MNAARRWALCALLFAAPSAFAQQDEIVLGSPSLAVPGEIVRVPVSISATPLDAGGAPIQWIDLSITNSHPHLVVGCLGTTYPNCDLQFQAAGVLAATPLETSGTLINIASLYVRRIFGQALPITGELQLIGYITFRLDPKAPLGTMIQLKFDPTKTFLASHEGKRIEGLTLIDTSIAVCRIITVIPPALPNGTAGYPYNQTICASGGTAPYAFSVSSGALPPGLDLLALNGTTGAITGTPDSAGTFTFTITATDANGCLGSRAYSITIADTPAGGPTLDFVGLTILVILLAAAGLFAMNRLSM